MRKDVLQKLEKSKIKYLQLRFVDNAGILRTKVILKDNFEKALNKGVNFSKAIMNFTALDNFIDNPTYGAATGDFWTIPDISSLRIHGFLENTAIVYCNLFNSDNSQFSNCHRSLLNEITTRTEENWGGEITAAFEPEFMILDLETKKPVSRSQLFSADRLQPFKVFFDTVINAAEKMNIPLIQISSESSSAQFEINIGKQRLLKACDDWVTLRNLLKTIGKEYGFLITFLPKPFNEMPGNGLHLHFSINNNGSLFSNKDKDNYYLNEKTLSFIAGLLNHGRALTALGASSVNSYKRFRPNSWAPTHLNWGIDDRIAFIRITEPKENRHLEIRFCDATCNPYLFSAALLAAGQDGVNKKIPLSPPASRDITLGKQYQQLPLHLGEAVNALKKDQEIYKQLRKELIQEYIHLKEAEWNSYLSQVSDWDKKFIQVY